MDKKRIIQECLAELDLLGHVDYISDHNPDAALRFVMAVESAFNRLLDMPQIGVIREFKSYRASNVRMWPIPDFDKYLIFYQEIEDGIRVLRILHGARDLPALFDNGNYLP